MICPHCAFPNEPGTTVCIKCKRSFADPAADAVSSLPPQSVVARPRPAPAGADSARAVLEEAARLEAAGDLRKAFLACQSLVIDQFGNLPPEVLAEVYRLMARISQAQGKEERARKYQQKADSLQRGATRAPGPLPPRPVPAAESPAAVVRQAARQAPSPLETSLRQVAEGPPVAAAPEPVAAAAALPPVTAVTASIAAPDGPDPAGAPATAVGGRLVLTVGIWRRLVATGIDWTLTSVVMLLAMGLSALLLGHGLVPMLEALGESLGNLVLVATLWVLLGLVYISLFHRFGGQTVGKMLLGIRVVQLDGHGLSNTAVLRRAVGTLLAALPGLAGLLWVAFDAERRGWHDRFGGTLVVRLLPPPPPANPEVLEVVEGA